MDASSQLISAIMMVVAAVSFFWVYKITSASGFRPRKQDRRNVYRFRPNERRHQAEHIDLSGVAPWLRRIAWISVAVVILLDLAATFDPIFGLI